MAKKSILLAFLVGCCWVIGSAQQDRPYVSTTFLRQNDFTYSTQFDTWYQVQKGKYQLDLRLGHSNIYNSSLNSGRFVQLYLKSSIWQSYQLKPKLDVVSWIETDQYFNNRNEKVNLYAGVRYRPFDFLTLTPLVGYTFDVRTAVIGQTQAAPRLDQGFTPAMYMVASKSWESEQLSTETSLFVRYKDISPRRQYNTTLQHFWLKQFEEGVQLRAGLKGGSHELDDYQGNSVKRIISDTLQPEVDIAYQFSKGLEWRSSNAFQLFRRRFQFNGLDGGTPAENNLTFTGMDLFTEQRIGVVRPKWKASGTYSYQFSTREYDLENTTNLSASAYENRLNAEKQKDFLKNFHKVELSLDTRLSKRQSLNLNLVNQYLQYDTQSELNFDDRDELSYLGSAEWQGRWRKNFYSTLAVSGNYRHYAFLLKEKSQDNYIQRSLRLEFRYGWDPAPKFRVEGDNSVYVTYNVKDFKDYNKTDRSTRNLETNLRAYYRPNKKLQVETHFRRKESHQSYLNWEQFSETTLDTNTITTIEHKYKFQWQGNGQQSIWFFEAGYKHFDQTKRFKGTMIGVDNLSGPISLRQINWQTGPLVNLGFRRRDMSSVDVGVWLQVQVRRNKFKSLSDPLFYPSIFREEELRITTTRMRPYMTIRLNIYLSK